MEAVADRRRTDPVPQSGSPVADATTGAYSEKSQKIAQRESYRDDGETIEEVTGRVDPHDTDLMINPSRLHVRSGSSWLPGLSCLKVSWRGVVRAKTRRREVLKGIEGSCSAFLQVVGASLMAGRARRRVMIRK